MNAVISLGSGDGFSRDFQDGEGRCGQPLGAIHRPDSIMYDPSTNTHDLGQAKCPNVSHRPSVQPSNTCHAWLWVSHSSIPPRIVVELDGYLATVTSLHSICLRGDCVSIPHECRHPSAASFGPDGGIIGPGRQGPSLRGFSATWRVNS